MSVRRSVHESINSANIRRLTIKDGALYWDGNRIKADIGLSIFQERLAIAAAVVTILSLILSGISNGIQIYDWFYSEHINLNESQLNIDEEIE